MRRLYMGVVALVWAGAACQLFLDSTGDRPAAEGIDGGTDGAGDASVSTACAPNATRCDGKTAQRCDDAGVWQSTPCPSAACAEGACVPIVQVVAGGSFACARLGDGTASCWGNNAFGQLGDGTTKDHFKPALVGAGAPLRGILSIAAGRHHACAIVAAGDADAPAKDVKCWGRNSSLQTGSSSPAGGDAGVLAPSAVNIPVAEALALGAETSCALVRGGVWCWGNGDTPKPVAGVEDAVELASGSSSRHACAVLSGGTVKCWGSNDRGQIGDGTTSSASVGPTTVRSVGGSKDLDRVVRMALGGAHSCAVQMDGTTLCWGDNENGQLGNDAVPASSLPVVVPVSGAQELTAGLAHTCQRVGEQVKCWGRNIDGQRGIAVRTPRTVLDEVPNLKARAIAAGDAATYVLMPSGVLAAFGLNMVGALGDGTSTARFQPTPVGVVDAHQVSVGGTLYETTFACAVHGPKREVSCWGNNDFGQLGDATKDSRDVPQRVGALDDVSQVAAGLSHACALVKGAVYCWGAGLAAGVNPDDFQLTPLPVAGIANVERLAAGAMHTCAVTHPDGGARQVYCWGLNATGQLGSAALMDAAGTPVPTMVEGGLRDPSEVVGAGASTCALDATDAGKAVRCWGSNIFGALGTGKTDDEPVPNAPALERSSLDGLVAGRAHVCVLQGGSPWCWGANQTLGADSGDHALSPVPIKGGPFAQLFGGGLHTCALDEAGAGARCWGFNVTGELGTGDRVSSAGPPASAHLANIQAFATAGSGAAQTCAIVTTDGGANSVQCWGHWQGSGRSAVEPVRFE